ncbi:hypothetical protein DICSQDRAFT_107124 [Dichomitus squalens LYAD-421 SS1]|uniref:DUF1479-domain-containing protein n=2 Tax=Dichomitus squalens TaxID=114155 RepID=A0A4Q9PNL4_9APHY|nr:uncharacterized protein DICSQDRAFT_107124 [Dichomitus squalens LYAD-421 SS1]EJF60723.1 hypothetical protein DICSQDRAFT_107124 [Dichomitus squalens LYAD-421 SS1]TBU55879.1 hypothetical protein BD310DRAFT_824915 [Dichomitus squalens]
MLARSLAQVVQKHTHARRATKKEGTVAEFFDNLTSESPPLPARFADLKKQMCIDKNAIEHAWRTVLQELDDATEEIVQQGNEMVLRVPTGDIQQGLSKEQLKVLKKTGVMIVTGGVSEQEALDWKRSLREYIAANEDKVKGAPPENIVFYEIYNSKAQTLARTHPALIAAQKYLLTLWHTSVPDTIVSVRTPISYFDRFRIRHPGPSVFTLGPHIDGGSIERWEDPAFRSVWKRILEGGDAWRQHDPFDISPRLDANQDLYNAPNQCSIFRPWQGWTALSHTGPGEGTLRVLPMLSLATAYIILRPFFRLRSEFASRISSAADIPLGADAWVLDLDNPEFPGSTPGKTQAITPVTHPHLRVDKTVLSIPRVKPGDQVYWHTDVIHAVEADHNGSEDSSVMYIPAVPLTERNAAYLRDQRETFLQGLPSPDFPGGEGESCFVGRGTIEHIMHPDGRRIIGLEPFKYAFVDEGERRAITAANEILGFE